MIVEQVELQIQPGDDIETFRNLPGILGVANHDNIIVLRYAQPLGRREKVALLDVLARATEAGNAVLSVIEFEEDS